MDDPMPSELLQQEIDDFVTCLKCEYTGFVRMGQDVCPRCSEEGNLMPTEEPIAPNTPEQTREKRFTFVSFSVNDVRQYVEGKTCRESRYLAERSDEDLMHSLEYAWQNNYCIWQENLELELGSFVECVRITVDEE
jgi:hypothetical protein